MAPLRDIVYRFSPYTLQNVLISCYGLYLRSIRYGQPYLQALRFLEQADAWNSAQIATWQSERLDTLVRRAVKDVPFYREHYAHRIDSTERIDSARLSRAFPVLPKEILKSRPGDFVSTTLAAKERTTVFTSGTTGAPLEVTATKTAVAKNFAFFSHFLQRCGLDPFGVSVTFAGRLIVPHTQQRAPFWRYNAATRTWLFSSYHISTTNVAAYVAKLEEIQPTYIDSYPSAIYALARYMAERRIAHSIRPKAIVTSSETLTPLQREAIESVFQCRVYDQYGSAEMVGFAAQCAAGSYHVHPLYGVVEVVDRDGLPCAAGEPGDLVLTGLLNDAMPLLRYRIGDQGAWRTTACPCGSMHPALQGILGREDDYIVTPEGNHVGRLDPLFKGLAGLVEAQIVQQSVERIEILVVPGPGFDAGAKTRLVDSLRERVGSRMTIDVLEVGSIPRTRNGKFRSVVSNIKSLPTS
jgi:phenylacetate-CoA ligase